MRFKHLVHRGGFSLALLGAIGLSALPAAAQQGRQGGGAGADALFQRVDSNGDGTISSNEFDQWRKRLFARADANKDGKLGREEFSSTFQRKGRQGSEARQGREGRQGRQGREARQGAEARKPGEAPRAPRPEIRDRSDARGGPGFPPPEQMMQHLDDSGDKKLQRAELPERMQAMFDRIDTDADGGLNVAELQNMHEQFRRRGQLRERGAQQRGDRPERRSRPNPGQLLEQFDKNNDGKLQLSEAPAQMSHAFDRLDTNGDGALDADELKRRDGRQRQQGQRQQGQRRQARPGR